MKVLVVNAGSSSLKYQLFDMDTETVLAKGICERIGTGSPAGEPVPMRSQIPFARTVSVSISNS